MLQGQRRVDEDVTLGVKFGRLRDAGHCGDLGQNHLQQPAGVQQPHSPPPPGGGEEPQQLVADALGTHLGDRTRLVGNGAEGVVVDVKLQFRRQTHRPQHP